MKIRYIGPIDEVEGAGFEFRRNHVVTVPDDVAGHPPEPRLAVAMVELREAVDVHDHELAAALRVEIVDLDYGTGLLAQDTFEAVAEKTKKKEDR